MYATEENSRSDLTKCGSSRWRKGTPQNMMSAVFEQCIAWTERKKVVSAQSGPSGALTVLQSQKDVIAVRLAQCRQVQGRHCAVPHCGGLALIIGQTLIFG